MPRYEYRCPECGATREVTHKIDESPLVACTRHHADRESQSRITHMEKVISVPSYVNVRGGTPRFHP